MFKNIPLFFACLCCATAGVFASEIEEVKLLEPQQGEVVACKDCGVIAYNEAKEVELAADEEFFEESPQLACETTEGSLFAAEVSEEIGENPRFASCEKEEGNGPLFATETLLVPMDITEEPQLAGCGSCGKGKGGGLVAADMPTTAGPCVVEELPNPFACDCNEVVEGGEATA